MLAQPLCFSISQSISTIHGGSHLHSQHLKTEEGFLLNLAPFSSRFMVLHWCHPLIISFDCDNSFLTIRSISWVVSISFLRRPSCNNYSFSACSYHSSNPSGASFKYTLISSCSLRSLVSKSPQVSSFVFQFFPMNCAFATFIFNSYGGSFKIHHPLLPYQIFVVSKSYGGSINTFSSLWYIPLSPFYENK